MHNRLKGIDGKTVVKILSYFGFSCDRQRGSHEQWEKGKFRVTIDSKAKSFALPTLKSMIEQSGYSEKDWVKLLDDI